MNIETPLKLLKFVRQNVDPEISVQKLQVLLTVLSKPNGIDQATLIKVVDQSRSGVSKNIADLTTLTAKKAVGPGLLRSEPDPMNLSTRIITPTAKGMELMKKIQALTGDAS